MVCDRICCGSSCGECCSEAGKTLNRLFSCQWCQNEEEAEEDYENDIDKEETLPKKNSTLPPVVLNVNMSTMAPTSSMVEEDQHPDDSHHYSPPDTTGTHFSNTTRLSPKFLYRLCAIS